MIRFYVYFEDSTTGFANVLNVEYESKKIVKDNNSTKCFGLRNKMSEVSIC